MTLSISLVMLITSIVTASFVTVIIYILLPLLIRKRKINKKTLDDFDKVMDKADTMLDTAGGVLPNNVAIKIAKIIERWAHIGVHEAEQLYLTDQLAKEERNEKARGTVYAILKTIKIDVTPEIEKMIDGAIEAEVLALGHKNEKAESQSS